MATRGKERGRTRKIVRSVEEVLEILFLDDDSDDMDLEPDSEDDDGDHTAIATADAVAIDESNEITDAVDNEPNSESDDSDDTVEYNVEEYRRPKRARQDVFWAWNFCDQAANYLPQPRVLHEAEGVRVPLSDNATALDIFQLYMTDDIFTMIVQETNRYAEQYLAANNADLKPFSLARKWTPTTLDEVKCFVAMLVLMGIVYKPRISMYWSRDALFATPLFGHVMSRDRFLLLLKFLHFCNNLNFDPGDPLRDRLFKIRQFTEMIRERCRAVYYPGQHLCVDESLVLFKGRLSFRQFIKTKRARFGIKFYQLCTSNGMLLDFMIYHGLMNMNLTEVAPDWLTTERIAYTLIENYVEKGHCLFVDNFYTTPRLAEYLLSKNTALVGTVRHNRKNVPKELVSKQLGRGEAAFMTSDKGVLAVKYRAISDKANKQPKVVYMLTTSHGVEMKNSGTTGRDGSVVMKPTCIIDYNHNMGGVDMVDQQLHTMDVLRKTYKWYKKVFLRLVMQCMLSAHRIYQVRGGKSDFLAYVHDVITQLLANSVQLQRGSVPQLDNIIRLTGRNHFPGKRPSETLRSKMPSKSKKCRVCRARGVTTVKGGPIKTAWVCMACPDQPGLCIDRQCFADYHTKLDFSS
jgi:hypothetical protein